MGSGQLPHNSSSFRNTLTIRQGRGGKISHKEPKPPAGLAGWQFYPDHPQGRKAGESSSWHLARTLISGPLRPVDTHSLSYLEVPQDPEQVVPGA